MQRPATARLSPGLALMVCGLCAACTERQLIEHPSDMTASVADDGSELESHEDDGANAGNFPDPAITECGNLPPGVDPIPGLATSWAVTGNAPGIDGDGLPYSDEAVRLRFADYAAGCDESFANISESCASAWNFAFSLPLESLTPGVHDLSLLHGLDYENRVSSRVDDECAGEGIEGGGVGPGGESQGELEIFAVTGGCVVGELRGLADIAGDLDVDRNGGFVAMRCDSDCVPMSGNDCGT